RRRHTRSDRDWSSDVCSSDLCLHEWLSAGVGEEGAPQLKVRLVVVVYPACPTRRSELAYLLNLRHQYGDRFDAHILVEDSPDGQIGRASCRERGKIGESERLR